MGSALGLENSWNLNRCLEWRVFHVLFIIEIQIKFLDSRLAVFSAQMNIIIITIPQNGRNFKRRALLLLSGGIRHLTATLQYLIAATY